MICIFSKVFYIVLVMKCILFVRGVGEKKLLGAKVASYRFVKKVAFAIRCKDAVAIFSCKVKETQEGKITRKLAIPKQSSCKEFSKITDCVYCITCGLSADSLYLVDKMKDSALSYRNSFGTSAPIEFIAQQASQTFQRLVSSSHHRPLAVNLILCSPESVCSMNCQGDYELTRNICSTVDDLLEATLAINKEDEETLFADSSALPMPLNQLKQIYTSFIDAESMLAKDVKNQVIASIPQQQSVSSFILKKP